MKTEQLIVQYLYSNKKVSLQDIGSFALSADLNNLLDNDKDAALPANSIQFTYDPRAVSDDGLVTYIMEHTRKIRPLAASDLESFIMLNRQFLNIGKPLIIEGLGTLQKTQGGEYAFIQSGTSHVIHEEMPRAVTEKQKEEVSFITPQKEKNSGSAAGIWVLVLLLLGGGGAAAYYFMHHQKEAAAENNIPVAAIDTVAKLPNVDSLAAKKIADSIAAIQPVKDSNTFYIVLKQYPDLDAAQKSFKRLSSYGNKLILFTKDSATYEVRMPFMRALADTMRVRDSLSKFFSAKAYVQLP